MNDKFGAPGSYRESREPFWRGSDGDRAASDAVSSYAPDSSPARYNQFGRYVGQSGDRQGGFRGRGPKGYSRTDDRIREDVCERLSWNDEIDATEINVRVENGDVILEGSVDTRLMKRLAEDLVERVPGVTDVHNAIRVEKTAREEKREPNGSTGPRTAERSPQAR